MKKANLQIELTAKSLIMLLMLFFLNSFCVVSVSHAENFRIAILMSGDNRSEPVTGFKQGLTELTDNQINFIFEIENAGGDRSRLLPLAEKIVASAPDLAVAAGGIEADALKEATANNPIPIVFLAVSSAIDRGLGSSMSAPGGNLTGIDTSDTELTAKRLWYVTKMLPTARKITIFSVPSITPSFNSTNIARQTAQKLGLELTVIESESKVELANKMRALKRETTDLVLLLPVAPTDQLVNSDLLPTCRTEKIPIMGYNRASLDRGAFATYGSSRFNLGAQASALAIKVLHGAKPGILPIEAPAQLFLTINRQMVRDLGLELPSRIWDLASDIVDFQP